MVVIGRWNDPAMPQSANLVRMLGEIVLAATPGPEILRYPSTLGVHQMMVKLFQDIYTSRNKKSVGKQVFLVSVMFPFSFTSLRKSSCFVINYMMQKQDLLLHLMKEKDIFQYPYGYYIQLLHVVFKTAQFEAVTFCFNMKQKVIGQISQCTLTKVFMFSIYELTPI